MRDAVSGQNSAVIRTLTIIVVGTLLIAAALTPFFYSTLEYFMGEVPWGYSRVYNRVAILVLIGLIVLLRKEFPMRNLGAFYRRDRWRQEWPLLLAGVGLTLALSLGVLPLVMNDGRLEWADRTFLQAASKLLTIVPAALLIAVFEESMFRGLIFQRLRSNVTLPVAVGIASFVYAISHLISAAKHWQYPGFSATIGFEYLGAVLERMLLPGVLSYFIGLFLVGLVLSLVLWRTGSLLLCIGLHSGWVIAMKLCAFGTQKAAGFEFPEGIRRSNLLVAEPLTWVSILLVGAIVLWGFPRLWEQRLSGIPASMSPCGTGS